MDIIIYFQLFGSLTTVEPRFNEPLCNEVLSITNDIFQPSNSVMYGKDLDITNPRYNEPISPVPWHFVKWRFHCSGKLLITKKKEDTCVLPVTCRV